MRILGGAVLALAGLAVAGAGAVILFLPGYVESRAREALREAGWPRAELVIEALDWSGATATVKLAGDQGIDTVRLDYTLGGLLDGRVDRVALAGLRLEIEADAGGISPVGMTRGEGGGGGTVDLSDLPVGTVALESGTVRLLTPAGPLVLPVSGEVTRPEPGVLAFTAGAGLDLGPVAGTVTLDGRYSGGAVSVRFAVAPHPTVTDSGRLSGGGELTWPGAGMPAGQADLDIAGARLPDGTGIEAALRWQGGEQGQSVEALLRPAGIGSVQVSGTAVQGADGVWRAGGAADLLVEDLAEAARLAGSDLEIDGRGMAALKVADVPLGGGPEGGRAPVDLALRLDSASLAGLIADADVTLAGRLVPDGQGWRFLSEQAVTVEGRARGPLAAALPTEPGTDALFLSLGPAAPDRPLTITYMPGGAGASAGLSGRFGLDAGASSAGGELAAMDLTLVPGGLGRVAAELSSVSLDAAPWSIALRGLGGTIAYAPGEQAPMKVRLSADQVRVPGDPSPVAPFALTLTATGDPAGEVTIQAEASAASGSILLEAFGTARPASGDADLNVQLYPVRFGQGGRNPADLSPLLARHVGEASGTVALKGRLALAPDALSGTAELLLEDVSLTGDAFVLQGLNAVVTADGIEPLRMPEQELSVGLLDVGIPLADGLIRYAVLPGERLSVERATFSWAGGTVRAQPFQTDLDDLTGTVVLEAERLELGRVLELAGVEGLAASGTLNGRIPVVVEDDGIRFEEGKLVAEGAGTIAYDPAEPPSFLDPGRNDSTGLVMQALTNFQYEELSITLDGSAGGEMAATLRIRGSNPDFYGGYPVALNLNLSGALGSILQSGVSTYRIPDTVRARIDAFRKTEQ